MISLRFYRQLYREDGTDTRFADHGDRTAHRFREIPDEPKAHSEARMCVASNRTFKSIEDTVLITVGDADAMVTNNYFSQPLGCGERQLDGFAATVFHGVSQ